MAINPVRIPPRSVHDSTSSPQTFFVITVLLADFLDDINELELHDDGVRVINLDDYLERPLVDLRPPVSEINVTVQELVGGVWGDVMNMEIDTELIVRYLDGNGQIELTIPDLSVDADDLRLQIEIVQGS